MLSMLLLQQNMTEEEKERKEARRRRRRGEKRRIQFAFKKSRALIKNREIKKHRLSHRRDGRGKKNKTEQNKTPETAQRAVTLAN